MLSSKAAASEQRHQSAERPHRGRFRPSLPVIHPLGRAVWTLNVEIDFVHLAMCSPRGQSGSDTADAHYADPASMRLRAPFPSSWSILYSIKGCFDSTLRPTPRAVSTIHFIPQRLGVVGQMRGHHGAARL